MSTTTDVKKKAVTKKPKTPKTTSHPSYFQMIKEALLTLKEKSGSSPHAIAKHMEENHKGVLPSNFRKILATQLKNSAAKGNLIRVKASFKLSEAAKKVTKPKKVTEPKKVTKPKKVTEPKKVTKPKKVTEPKKATKPKKVTKPAAVKTKKVTKPAAVKAKKVTKKRLSPKKVKAPAAKRAKKA